MMLRRTPPTKMLPADEFMRAAAAAAESGAIHDDAEENDYRKP